MNVTGNFTYKTIPTKKGNNLIMLKNYTFSKDSRTRNYYCSSKLRGCRARFKMDEKGDIIHGDFTHTHDPPKYAISSSGHYIKLVHHDTINEGTPVTSDERIQVCQRQQEFELLLHA
ncbi:hypothetical protein ABMA27_001324 [Loxostege sticticalis]|uniref:FLYWCH-type domain-containing protein n=1 Tax=Loxostege sticticalis TaxID=481309 RepID=A0ABR3HY41_LOXSC